MITIKRTGFFLMSMIDFSVIEILVGNNDFVQILKKYSGITG
jgi:hypothetical protein